jgi:NAD(P)-dependent dehydrogenase (short-subunit alcohol dehydrogenase family)
MSRTPKTCLITGGARGIGAAIAYRLGKSGQNVVIADVDEEGGKWRERQLSNEGIQVKFLRADVSSEPQVKELMSKTAEIFGGIDVLVNNAGIGSPGKPIEEQTLQEWQRVINVNLTGTWLCSKYAVPHMKDKGGVIVNIASTRAFQSEPNTEPYSASKGGIVALTHSLAVSLARYGIRVVSISPGWVDTSQWQIPPRPPSLTRLDNLQHPAGRVGRPEDIASLVSFLASEEASWITGVNFTIDGGMTVKMIYLDEGIIGQAISLLTEDQDLGRALEAMLRKLNSMGPDDRKKFKKILKDLAEQS